MQIEHKPMWEEWERQREAKTKEYGRPARPSDLFIWLFPVFCTSVALFIWRY